MAKTLLGLDPKDFIFREIVFAIFSLAAGLTGTLRFENCRMLKGIDQHLWHALYHQDRLSEAKPSVVSIDGIRYHVQCVELGSCPSNDDIFWFKDVLIRCSVFLKYPKYSKAALAEAVEFGNRTKARSDPFDILMISIEHIVIARVFDGYIEVTNASMLMRIPMHFTHPP